MKDAYKKMTKEVITMALRQIKEKKDEILRKSSSKNRRYNIRKKSNSNR